MKLRFFIIVFFMLWIQTGFAQVVFQFIPEIQGRTIDGLLNCRILNSSQKQNTFLTITVTERKNGQVCYIKTPVFTLAPGSNLIPPSAVRNASIRFPDNRVGKLIDQNGSFPEGDYEFCFTLVPQGQNTANGIEEQCYNYDLAPFTDLLLLEPYNEDKSCTHRPMFTWQPLVPAIQGMMYQLTLVEIKENQKATEALSYNLPIVNQNGIISSVLPYPPASKELKTGKKYAWQVTAYKGETVLSRSEVWDFTIDCQQDSIESPPVEEGFRDIEDLLKGNFYVADGFIRFALVNSYDEQNLKYEINNLTDPGKKVKKLPKIKLKKGRNKVSIDLRKKGGFKDGYYYVLKVWLPNGAAKSLRFIYKELE